MPSNTVKAAHNNNPQGRAFQLNTVVVKASYFSAKWEVLVTCGSYQEISKVLYSVWKYCHGFLFSIPIFLHHEWQSNIPKWCSCIIITVDLFLVFDCALFQNDLCLDCTAQFVTLGTLPSHDFYWFMSPKDVFTYFLVFVLKIVLPYWL